MANIQPIATFLREQPEIHAEIFEGLEAGWQDALHEAGGYHERYATGDFIPFALAFALDTDDSELYNPTLLTSQLRPVAFDFIDVASNASPEVYPIGTDMDLEWLGVDGIPSVVSMGYDRFSVFAAAKIFRLVSPDSRHHYTSFNGAELPQLPGQFGMAGAVRDLDEAHRDLTVDAVSGGWQIDDNAAALIGLNAGRQTRDDFLMGNLGPDLSGHLRDVSRTILLEHTELVDVIIRTRFQGKPKTELTQQELGYLVRETTGNVVKETRMQM
jgi:hypothetical protein